MPEIQRHNAPRGTQQKQALDTHRSVVRTDLLL